MTSNLLEPSRLERWRAKAALDFHILITLLFRGWSVLAGAATLLLLPLYLSPTEQGYYYTFWSILALQIFFELGLNQIIIQLVSHEVAHLQIALDGKLYGNAAHLARLGSLVRMVKRWYVIAALLFTALGGPVGAFFFMHRGTQPVGQWLPIWIVLISATAINLWYSPQLALHEGCGRVGQVARLRLLQSVIGYLALWGALAMGARLWAAMAVPVVCAVCTGGWLHVYGRALQAQLPQMADAEQRIRWRTDVLPLQWRIAVSWISGYFIFNFFTPMVFSHQGAEEAGRIGMALAIFNSISTVGMSWVNAKSPNFTMHISRGERHELNTLFVTVAIRSVIFTATVSIGIVLAAWILAYLQAPIMARIAAPKVLSSLAIATAVNSFIFAAATYMRAHREEPMLPVSVASAILMGLAVYFGSRISTSLMTWLYCAVTVLLTLPWTAWLFNAYFKRKQCQPSITC